MLDGQSIYDYTRGVIETAVWNGTPRNLAQARTIHDNIAFGNPDASREQVIAAAKAANADFSSNSCHREF